jgi:ribosome biogenesis GTPase A
MTKSIRQIESALKLIDFVVYIVDSRAPYSCHNPSFDALFKGMPIIYVLNKVDLGDSKTAKIWLQSKCSDITMSVSLDSRESNQAKILSTCAKQICKTKIDKFKQKGITISLRGMVVGLPNVGKSTLINNLAGSKKTKTGDMPGVTLGQQWVKIDDYLDVLDTPGTLYPKLSDRDCAIKLALIGCIKDHITDSVELGLELVDRLQKMDNTYLKEKYGCNFDVEPIINLNQIALKRGFLLKGGQVDLERAAVAVVDDFRKGRLGRISLDVV